MRTPRARQRRDSRRQRAGRGPDPALHPGGAPGAGGLPGPRGGPGRGVRRQPAHAARGAQTARQRQSDQGQQGPGRRHLRRPHGGRGHGPQPQRRDRDDARDAASSRSRSCSTPACCWRCRSPAWPPTSPTRRTCTGCARPFGARRPPTIRTSWPTSTARSTRRSRRRPATGCSRRSPAGSSTSCSRRVNAALHEAIVQSAIVEQHEALLAAIEKGDAPRAERAMKDHLLYLRDVLRMVQERAEG